MEDSKAQIPVRQARVDYLSQVMAVADPTRPRRINNNNRHLEAMITEDSIKVSKVVARQARDVSATRTRPRRISNNIRHLEAMITEDSIKVSKVVARQARDVSATRTRPHRINNNIRHLEKMEMAAIVNKTQVPRAL